MAANEEIQYQYPGETIYKQDKVIPLQQPTRTAVKQKASTQSTRRSLVWTKLEKILAGIAAFVFISCSIFTVYTTNQVNHLNRQIQNVERQRAETEIANENLKQNAHELSQYERVKEIAEKNGLEFNDENVRNISR